jgi:RNA polymerase sigma-70 factor (ECF subfamily)
MLAHIAMAPTDWDTELERALSRGYVAAFRWLGNRDESRDLCQEAAARALAARRSYDPQRPFYPWFYRILRNLCMDRLGRRRLAGRAADELQHATTPQTSVELSLLAAERHRLVARAIEQLSPEQREVIELRHFQDLSYEEMAQILGCPTGTVMSRLYRARRALRQHLHDIELEEGGTP